MKTTISRWMAGIALALAVSATPAATVAAQGNTRYIDVTYCWSLTSFGPGQCDAQWPTVPLALAGGNNQGTAMYAPGTTDAMTGTYEFKRNRNEIVLRFVNPEPGIASVTYSGARYAGGGNNCYRGAMVADFTSDPDATGVWFGCIRN